MCSPAVIHAAAATKLISASEIHDGSTRAIGDVTKTVPMPAANPVRDARLIFRTWLPSPPVFGRRSELMDDSIMVTPRPFPSSERTAPLLVP